MDKPNKGETVIFQYYNRKTNSVQSRAGEVEKNTDKVLTIKDMTRNGAFRSFSWPRILKLTIVPK